ncbi:MAG: twin-arginine translocase subunit TatC [Phascolarctobacterium sp.]|nr:twin-arginine translocase subunit TatC [Phascolarctobacterium sp.]
MTAKQQNNNYVADPFDEVQSYEPPLKEHIKELRTRLLWCLGFLCGSFFVIATFFASDLMQLLTEPIKSRGIQFIYLGLSEALVAQLKVSFIAAVVVSAPVIFWHIWDFIRPALYENEKKVVILFSLGSVFLFILGVAFGYGVVFLSAITFFVFMGENLATPMLSISQYVGFLFGFVLSFGVVFELPVVVYVLCKLGVVTVEQLVSLRKYMVLVIFVFAAFLTPPDVLSQCLMAFPMIVLYEIGIIVAKLGR